MLRNTILIFIVLITTSASADLTAWHKFDEGFGATVADSSGNSHDGEILGAMWSYGRLCGSLAFDGSDDYVNIDSIANDVNPSHGSIACWMKLDPSAIGDGVTHGLIEIGNSSSTDYFIGLRKISDETISMRYRNGSVNYDATISDISDFANWHHVAAVWTDTEVKIYVDGIIQDTQARGSDITGELNMARIGRKAQGTAANYVSGWFDDVRIYDSALSTVEIEGLASQEAALASMDDIVVYDPAVGNWSLLHTKPSPLFIDGQYDSAITGFGAQTGAPGLVGDVDGDGYDDVVSVVSEAGQCKWHSGISTVSPGGSNSNVASLGGSGPNTIFGSESTALATFLGDVDGDGAADAILVEEGVGGAIQWSARKSIPGVGLSVNPNDTTVINFGTTAVGDVPLVGDFNGDGRVDICIFRPSGTWFTKMSDASGQFGDGASFSAGFGTTGDRPLLGDINGDGRNDAIALRDNGGDMVWYVAFTDSNGQVAGDGSHSPLSFGKFTDTALVADISGDGLGDIGLHRTVSGQDSIWYFSFTEPDGTPQIDAEIFIEFGSDSSLPLIGEFGAHRCPYVLIGDLDGDCDVDLADYSITAQNWFVDPLNVTAGDLDGDRDVDFADIAISSENWLEDCINAGDNALCEQPVRNDRQRTYLSFDLNLAAISQAEDLVADMKNTFGSQNHNSERMYAFGMCPPILLNMSVSELQNVVNVGFDLALQYDIPVFFHCDYMYGVMATGGGASPKWYDEPSMCEWTTFPEPGYSYGPIPNQWANWGSWFSTPAIPCYESPTFKPFIKNQFKEGIVSTINTRLQELRVQDKEYLFAGVSVGWETHIPDQRPEKLGFNPNDPPVDMFDPTNIMQPWEMHETGYAALSYLGWNDSSLTLEAANRGISKSQLIRDLLHEVLHDYMEMFAKLGWESGIDKDKMFTHIVPMESVYYGDQYQTTNVPPIWTAVNDYSIPGFTMDPYGAATYNMSNLKSMISAADPTQQNLGSCESYVKNLQGYSLFKGFLNQMSGNGGTMINILGWDGQDPASPYYID